MKTQIRVEAREILFVFIMTLLIALTPLKAYGQQQDGDKLVYVPQRYVSAEGLTHVTAPTTSVTNVLGWGKENKREDQTDEDFAAGFRALQAEIRSAWKTQSAKYATAKTQA